MAVIRQLVAAILCLVFSAASASAQDWAKKMFTDVGTPLSHDFGTVAKGAKVEYRFKFRNLYEEDVHVAGVSSSCACTSPECAKPLVKKLEDSEIIATFNTGAFTGPHHATLTVTIDKPFFATVQLNVSGTIRTDVTFTPNFVDFGEIDRGDTTQKRIQVNYQGGRNDWKIDDVLCLNTDFEVVVNQVARGGGQAAYDLLIRLKPDAKVFQPDAKVTFIKDQLLLVTNEGKGIQIPLDVEGRVVPEIKVSPTSIYFGTAQVGQTLTKQIVVKAKKPFNVTDVQCDDPAFSCTLPTEKKTLHLIPITFTAGKPGKISQKIHIKTDISSESPEIAVSAQVAAPDVNVAGATN